MGGRLRAKFNLAQGIKTIFLVCTVCWTSLTWPLLSCCVVSSHFTAKLLQHFSCQTSSMIPLT